MVPNFLKVAVMTIQPTVRSVAGQNSSAVDLVTAEIRRAILTGALPAGEQFSIRELAGQLGVSHIPIREALRRLESQGLILLKQARSAEVASLTTQDLEAIYALRLRIEPQLAADAVPLHTEADIERLTALLEASRGFDPESAWGAHHSFHEALIEPAATEWDKRILETLWTAAERYTHLVFDYTAITDEERAHRYDRHLALLNAVIARDQAGMLSALTYHLTTNEDEVRRHIKRVESLKRSE
jgi:DNA-binding GntR family transcriptional regulator